jgi:lipoyl(octanoyl) transferase
MMLSMLKPPVRFRRRDGAAAGWAISPGLTPYPAALDAMEARAEAIAEGQEGEVFWLLEHPPIYTAGVSAKAEDLLSPDLFPVYPSGRGGRHTYHGPGQRVVYVMLDLRERARDVRALVAALEQAIINTLRDLGVEAGLREGRVGVWVDDRGNDLKIAAIGLRLRRWVSLHGISLNVAPDLSHFAGITPCGIREHGVTSLAALGRHISPDTVDEALRSSFDMIFGPLSPATPPSISRDP